MQVRYDVSGCIQVFDARSLMFINGLDDRFCDAAIRRMGRFYGGRPDSRCEWVKRAVSFLRVRVGCDLMLAGDHFVWPTLVGGAARLPFLFAFVGIFGGIAKFGLVGLFVGPRHLAALLTVWREWIVRSTEQKKSI